MPLLRRVLSDAVWGSHVVTWKKKMDVRHDLENPWK
jgi:hypothetical protein